MQITPNVEQETFSKLIYSELRLDGRSFKETRDVKFRFPQGSAKDGGACIASIGGTAILATISLDVVEPRSSRPTQGNLLINFDLKKLNHVMGKRGPRRFEDEGRRLSSMLQNCLMDSIDLNNLCIVAWERVFSIKIELSVISCDGNLADAGALAAVAALMTFKRPDIYVDSVGKVQVDYEELVRPKIALSLIRMPVLITFALTHSQILVDPTMREELLLNTGRVIVGMTEFNEVCCLFTTGIQSRINPKDLDECVALASVKARGLVALLRQVLDSFEKYRNVMIEEKKGRQSEVIKARDLLGACPVMLSSADFIELHPQSSANDMELGEVVTEPEEIIISDNEEEKTASNEDKNSPYGFIELGTKEKLRKRKHQPQPDDDDDDNPIVIL
ncbi:Exosome complex component RRP45 [Cichlidogyrus casuarinus]|uniref:Exosome complex component RRP45 n=1 Tax=Cichlidogyrus casuarinus TaxID=1844966 RepID=A0ABD2QDT7_9PLAT